MPNRDQFFFISPLHTGSCAFPFMGGLLLLLQGCRYCAGAHSTPGYHIWRAHSEDRETSGIEPGPLDLQTNALPTELTGRPRLVPFGLICRFRDSNAHILHFDLDLTFDLNLKYLSNLRFVCFAVFAVFR